MSTRPIEQVDRFAAEFLRRYSLPLMRWSLVIVLVWSGLLAIAGMSSEMALLAQAIGVPVGIGVVVLGVWEVVIGLGLINDRTVPIAVVLMIGYVAVTMVPLFVMPEVTFVDFPLTFSFEGAYILKNWALLGGVIMIGGLRSK